MTDRTDQHRISRPYTALLVGYVLLLIVITVSASLGAGLWVIEVAGRIPYGDKLGHFLLSGVLAFLLNGMFRLRRIELGRVPVRLGSLVAGALVMLEEVAQIGLPTRRLDLNDSLCAFAGILVFSLLATRAVRD